VRSSALLLAIGVVLAACGDDEPSADVSDLAAEYGRVVEPDGTVLAVSTQGRAVIQDEDDQLCVVDLAGAGEPRCATADVDGSLSASSVVFSPDGSKVAFDELADTMRVLDSDIRVLDVDSGAVTTVADDGADDDDPGAPQDLLPAWVDDDELAFLRLPGMGTGPRDSAQVVFADLDGELDVVDADGLSPRDVAVGTSAAVLDDRYLLASSADPARLVTVDDDGLVEVVTALDGGGGSIGGTSRDGEQAVVVINGPAMDLVPAVHVDAGGDDVVATPSPFPAVAATVSPDGSIVAALTFGSDPGRTGITLWDPVVDDQQVLAPGGEVPTLTGTRRVVWTDDDRIVLWSSAGWQVVDVR
jgi:hypothetical protein